MDNQLNPEDLTPDPKFSRNIGRKTSLPAVVRHLAVYESPTGRNFTEEGREAAKKTFLEAYAQFGTIARACRIAGISRPTYNNWMERDTEFADGFRLAAEDYQDSLRDEIHRRAVEGVVREKHTYYKGELVGIQTEREYSDSLLMATAKAKLPEFKPDAESEAEGKIPLAAVLSMMSALGDAGIPGDLAEDPERPKKKEDAHAPTREAPIDAEYRFRP